MTLVDYFRRVKNFRLLPPRDSEFYDLFEEMASTVVEASEMLKKLFSVSQDERTVIETAITTHLTRTNQIVESIEALLRNAQQPPFDRAEISEFSDGMGRIIKYMGHAANRFLVYDFPTSDKEMREMAALIGEACVEISKSVRQLAHNRNLDPYVKAVDRLETQADDIYHGGLSRRFREIRNDRAQLQGRIDSFPPNGSCQDLLPILTANVEYTRHVAVFFALRQVYAELERAIDAGTDLMSTLQRMVTNNV